MKFRTERGYDNTTTKAKGEISFVFCKYVIDERVQICRCGREPTPIFLVNDRRIKTQMYVNNIDLQLKRNAFIDVVV